MGQKLQDDSIGTLSIVTGTQYTLGASVFTLGGQQYSESLLTGNTGTTGIGGIDTGAIAALTVYAVYVVRSAGINGLVFSTSAVAPTGFSLYKFIGLFKTNGSSDITNISSSMNSFYTSQSFTSGSGTYTTPIKATRLRVRMVAGGGGSAGSGSAGQTAGGTGGVTTFGTSLLACNGGGGGQVTPTFSGGTGGTASITGLPLGYAKRGGDGQAAAGNLAAGIHGANGGVSPFSGAGAGRSAGEVAGGSNAVANSGSGAGGSASTSAAIGAAGGGSGGYIDAIITSPSATYAYAIGAGGTAGGAGTSGGAGGTGGSGFIIVEEFYN